MASDFEMGLDYLSSYDPVMPIELGHRLRQAREAAGMSQRAAARRLGGVTHGAVSQWESSGQVSMDNLLRAAALYGADPLWVMTGKGRSAGAREHCDRAVMTDAMTAVLTVLQDLERSPPPPVTARIVNLIYNRHVEHDPSLPLDAERVRQIVRDVLEYLGDGAAG